MLLLSLVLLTTPNFEAHFDHQTMRLDFFHTGNHEGETIAIDRTWNDGPWAGPVSQFIDPLNRGAYRFEIRTQAGELIFSKGFASIFGEWQTTGEAKKRYGTFHESIRFPWPKNKVHILIQKRVGTSKFETVWKHLLDPAYRQHNRSVPPASSNVRALFSHGPSEKKVDIVLLSDGFKEMDKEAFFSHGERLSNALFEEEPFKSRKTDFNIWAVFTPSHEKGISKPHHGIHTRSALECQYSSFDSERYILSTANKKVRDAASLVPYDFTIILIDEETYGGGGIYQLYATCPVHSEQSIYLFIHEFGHHFAALADEYFTSDVAYEVDAETERPEPWEPNITAHPKREELKWAHLVKEDMPLPTPWEKKRFEALGKEVRERRHQLRSQHADESQLNALFKYQADSEYEIFKTSPYYLQVGAFEGGGYVSNGIYRPAIDCLMFSRNPVGFCPVCQEAIGDVIDYYTK